MLFIVGVLIAGATALRPVLKGGTSGGGSSGSTGATAVKSVPGQLSLRYKSGTAAAATAAQPWLQLVNTSAQPIQLSQVTMRYYFSADGGSYSFNCVQAAIGCSNITESVVALDKPTATADHYLQVGFTAAAGTLAVAKNTGDIEVQLYRPGGTKLNQANDYSFSAPSGAKSPFKPWKQMTAYLAGALTWGTAPGADDSAATAAAGTVAAAAPTGVLFDDFHYSGAADPALYQHGWLVRTGAGRPGILDTWSSKGVSFPSDQEAQGGEVLDLSAATDGTKAGTTQAEVQSSSSDFFTGTYAARIYFNDKPTTGANGDHINESFYMISPDNSKYSELDNEYQPNGGWGAPGPRLDTTSWYSADNRDRITQKNMFSIAGWHTMVITAADGVATYSIDGKKLFSTSGKYYPREGMSVNFNTWFVDLPFTGQRSWDMKVNWFYYNSKDALSLDQVQQQVDGFYKGGTNYVDTLAKP
ncbi:MULTISPECIES: cellulose binding domain-containing protein [Streptacidiphilus]|uniref:Cellulose binding domain-containing protein n=2 Tax=Streptacidiphilus TaxID=228398 RepID=A0ABV6UGL1_9ACTN|nr:cellulose binding domain-containing protein [Streptacidiphilus jeojiense]